MKEYLKQNNKKLQKMTEPIDKNIMPFSKWEGHHMDDVPSHLLLWLSENEHPRDKQVRKDYPHVFEYIENHPEKINDAKAHRDGKYGNYKY